MHPNFTKTIFHNIGFLMTTVILVFISPGMAVKVNSSMDVAASHVSASSFTKLELYPNIETMGVVVSGINLPKTAQLMYRKSGDTDWHTGHALVLVNDGRLIGSLFWLTQSTAYDVKVVDGSTEISGSSTTQSDQLPFTPSAVLHVNASAPPGGDGSANAPFQTIQQGVNHAIPGTQVLVADGIYHEQVTFPASGTAGNWIQVKAEGNGAVLDGSVTLSGKIWTPSATVGRVWSTGASVPVRYLARDASRFYMYDNLSGLVNAIGHNKVPMTEGWFVVPGTSKIYVRSLDDPSSHVWHLPQLYNAFYTEGRDWIWIEGFEMRYYGCGVCAANTSHLVIRKNKIHGLQLGIYFNWYGNDNQGNDTRVEYNEIYDPPVNEWPWKAVKGTSMEGTAIVARGHVGTIVRGNDIHNYNNGIYTDSSAALQNSGIAFDADIYNNYIHQISDDALEPEGTNVNERFRNNVVDSAFTGISLAPITEGPTWVLRNVFTNFTSTSIKWDLNSSGYVFIYNNTSWTNASNLNAMSMIHPVHNAFMRNNVFSGNGYAFEEPFTGSTGMDWNNDNWFTTRGSTGPHFKWENISYNTIAQLCAATKLECNGFDDSPGFANPTGGDFTLQPTSPNIDRGILIPGINDVFTGKAPDIGAYESGSDQPPRVTSVVRADPNRTKAASVNFTVTFSKPVTGVDGSDFSINASGVSGAGVTNVSGSSNVYTVTVNTGGNSNGTLGLTVKDDDSIIDAASSPLGGPGVGNGSFALGEIYTVAKATTLATFNSSSTYDGWILEKNENTGIGGSTNSVVPYFYLGDNAQNRQFRTILHFATTSLPDNAVIVSATLKIKKASITGADPFLALQNILADIRSGPFGTLSVQSTDFQAASSMDAAGTITNTPVSNWYSTTLDPAALAFINMVGPTQFRLRFQMSTDRNFQANTIKFYSGDDASSNRPVLQVEYYTP